MFYEISNKNVTYKFDHNQKHCLTVKSSDYILFHTLDAHSRTVNTEKVWVDVSFPELDETTGNPVTGPVYVEEAEPGNVLKVTILEIIPDEFGILPVRSYMGVLRDVVPERTARVVRYWKNRLWISEKISVPARPMVGTIGVAPRGNGIPTAPPGNHGGNMDDNCISVGAEVYLPVYQKGAYLGLGDIHAAMGEGELTCGGADICARVLIKIEVIESSLVTENPIVIKDDYVVTHGFAECYPNAAEMATEEMCTLLMDKMQISKYEAYILLAARGDLGLCQACRAEAFSIPMVVRLAFPIIW